MKKMFAIVLALMLCVGVMSVAAFAAGDTITVHVAIDSESAPNAWAWGDYGNAFSTWPGEAMTKNGDWWEITVPAGTTGFIANNGSAQTADIAILGDADAWIEISADFSSYEIVAAPGCDPIDPPTDPVDPPAGDVSYYVAGSAGLCGSEWKENDDANKMTAGANGVYSITYSNVAAGDYELKVTDGTWDNCWPAENYKFNVAEAADVVVEFDSVNKVVTVKVGGKTTEKEENKVDPNASYYVAGVAGICGSEWKENDEANKMTYKDGVYTITYKDVAAGKYSLKVTNGTWEKSWGGTGENGNFDFEVTAKGDVTVEFNPAKQQVSIIIGNERIDGPAITGDVSLAAVSVALLAATAGLVAVVSKKKEF